MLAAATAVVIGAGYLTWSPPARPSEGDGRSRSRGHAAVIDHQELQRLIGAYEGRVRARPNAADYALIAPHLSREDAAAINGRPKSVAASSSQCWHAASRPALPCSSA